MTGGSALWRSSCRSLASSHPTSSTLLPFLYSTRTIQRFYSADALSEEADIPPRRRTGGSRALNYGSGTGQNSGYRKTYDARMKPGAREGRSHTEASNREYRGRGNPRQDYEERKFAPRVDHVPFERPQHEVDALDEIPEGSTITSTERRAFEDLFRMGKDKEAAPVRVPRGQAQASDPLDSVLQEAVNAIRKKEGGHGLPAALVPIAKRARTQSERKEGEESKWRGPHSLSYIVRMAAKEDLERVEKKFQAAKSDIELWELLHEHVLSRVIALNLDPSNPWQDAIRTKYKHALPKDQVSRGKAQLITASGQPAVTDRDVLTETLPEHVLVFQRILREGFPGSPLRQSLLPYLKRLGPTTFALAASTPLYNLHLGLLAKKQLDFHAVVQTLVEMDKHVYQFNDRTLYILHETLIRQRRISKGMESDGLSAVWSSQKARDGLKRIYEWSRTVQRRLEERALREARGREYEESRRLLKSANVEDAEAGDGESKPGLEDGSVEDTDNAKEAAVV